VFACILRRMALRRSVDWSSHARRCSDDPI
jgi:hypothetical protein